MGVDDVDFEKVSPFWLERNRGVLVVRRFRDEQRPTFEDLEVRMGSLKGGLREHSALHGFDVRGGKHGAFGGGLVACHRLGRIAGQLGCFGFNSSFTNFVFVNGDVVLGIRRFDDGGQGGPLLAGDGQRLVVFEEVGHFIHGQNRDGRVRVPDLELHLRDFVGTLRTGKLDLDPVEEALELGRLEASLPGPEGSTSHE